MTDLDYPQRLEQINLPGLEFRRLRGDMIEVYKILHEKYDPATTSTLLTLKAQKDQITSNLKRLDQILFFFTNRVLNLLDSLPKEIVNASNGNTLKKTT